MTEDSKPRSNPSGISARGRALTRFLLVHAQTVQLAHAAQAGLIDGISPELMLELLEKSRALTRLLEQQIFGSKQTAESGNVVRFGKKTP